MLVGIPYFSNSVGLAALLVNLQTQTTKSDCIYIIDNSPDKKGLQVAKLYAGSKTPIIVEVASFPIYHSWNVMLTESKEQNQEGTLILNDDVLLSNTCLLNLKRAHKMTQHLCLVTSTPRKTWYSDKLDPNFAWYNRMSEPSDIITTHWMPGFAFYLKAECVEKIGLFDEQFEVWFGDTDYQTRIGELIGKVCNEYIYHFGNKSFNYRSQEVRDKIASDQNKYETKYKQI